MKKEILKVGPSIQIEGIKQILEERKEEIKVSYGKDFAHLPDLKLKPYQIVVNFTEEEFCKLQKKLEGKNLSEFLHSLAMQNT